MHRFLKLWWVWKLHPLFALPPKVECPGPGCWVGKGSSNIAQFYWSTYLCPFEWFVCPWNKPSFQSLAESPNNLWSLKVFISTNEPKKLQEKVSLNMMPSYVSWSPTAISAWLLLTPSFHMWTTSWRYSVPSSFWESPHVWKSYMEIAQGPEDTNHNSKAVQKLQLQPFKSQQAGY